MLFVSLILHMSPLLSFMNIPIHFPFGFIFPKHDISCSSWVWPSYVTFVSYISPTLQLFRKMKSLLFSEGITFYFYLTLMYLNQFQSCDSSAWWKKITELSICLCHLYHLTRNSWRKTILHFHQFEYHTNHFHESSLILEAWDRIWVPWNHHVFNL